uniref:ribosomal protein S3 n=1 Tax=Haramonas pauciplastida TaxID=478668 RepID=UPI0021156EED|nr:ribosomal protein S3 [Haramonas pauciplastida]UTE94975.1 ribosomal protein S3 [Haramonas pauciplastida]
MGHKTHPLGFRLGITQKYQSSWFSKANKYSSFLNEDYQIRKYIYNFLVKKGIKPVLITNITITRNGTKEDIEVTLCSPTPGVIVGKFGVIFKDLKVGILNKLSDYKNVKFTMSKTKAPFSKASLVADFIIIQLEKRIQFKRAMKKAIEEIGKSKQIQGVKIEISGRLNGSEIARSEWLREGRVPLQTLRANIDYSSKSAKTIYGIMGVKVWLFKGENFDH